MSSKRVERLRGSQITVLASPLRHKKKEHPGGILLYPPLVSRNLKQGGARRLLIRNHQMELEVSTLKRRIMASKEHQRKMKADMREQRDHTFKIISQVAQVLEDKENQILGLHAQRESELSKLSRELLILRSNMLKERNRLQGIISELSTKVTSQDSEIKKLKKRLSFQKTLRSNSLLHEEESPTSDLETLSPSSEESSPKSSGLSVKTPPQNNKLSSKAFSGIIQSSKSPSGQSSSSKPPLPSRVGVNRKINYRLKEMRMKDEGFFSSYEDTLGGGGGGYPRNSPHPHAKRTMSFQHDLRVKSIGNFGTLEELNVSSGHHGANEKGATTIIRYLDYL